MQASKHNETQQNQAPKRTCYRIVFSYSTPSEFSSVPQKVDLKAEVFLDLNAATLAIESERDVDGRSVESWLCKMTPDAIDNKIAEVAEQIAYHYRTLGRDEEAIVTVEKILWTDGGNPRIDNTPRGMIRAAYAEVQALTDEGDQLHRRAVVGKPLCVHLHGWDKWANEIPAGAGMSELRGGRTVTLRVQGQCMDRGIRYTAKTTAEAVEFAEDLELALARMPVPVPAAHDAQVIKNQEEIMEKTQVAIEVDGEITTGVVISGVAELGETVTVELRDENGMLVQQTGVVVEVI